MSTHLISISGVNTGTFPQVVVTPGKKGDVITEVVGLVSRLDKTTEFDAIIPADGQAVQLTADGQQFIALVTRVP